jgi:hypothetical protein
MGGGDGVIIISDGVAQILKNPQVHGRLPASMIGALDVVLAMDPCDWSENDRAVVAHAIHWAVCNLR